jgi:hypothetical protein
MYYVNLINNENCYYRVKKKLKYFLKSINDIGISDTGLKKEESYVMSDLTGNIYRYLISDI